MSAVKDVRRQMPRLGTRKLYHLIGVDIGMGRDKSFAILRANNLLIRPKRIYRTTTNSHHMFRKHKNLITALNIIRPDQVWVSDITYIGSRNRHNYLSLVTDAYSKKIVGYDLSDNLSAAGSVRALRLALRGRKGGGELIHHSDRGVQYCCDEYQRELNAGGITVSVTESYDPYANAIAERVNGILKDEFLLESYDVGLDVLSRVVTQSIDIYNNKRPHYSCALLTPTQMHLQSELPRAIYTKKIRSKPALAPENILNNFTTKL